MGLKLCREEIVLLKKFFLFFTIIFFKCLAFHYGCFHYLAIGSLISSPSEFFAFYFAKILPAVFIASFLFISKKGWWSIPIIILVDIWLVANYIYYRANDLFIDVEVIEMIGNMSGFWGAIVTYVDWNLVLCLAFTILYSIVFYFINKQNKNIKSGSLRLFFLCQLITFLLLGYDFLLGYGKQEMKNSWQCNMFQGARQIARGECAGGGVMKYSWVENGTPLHFLPAYIYYKWESVMYKKNITEENLLSSIDESRISEFYSLNKPIKVKGNLIVVLFESFESWTMFLKDEKGIEVTKNLNRLVNERNVLYASHIRSQAKMGSSGDGQMIVNTGLLPLQKGAACMLFGDNVYPNFAHFYNSVVINPSPNTWNQSMVSLSYGYEYTDERLGEKATFDDAEILNRMLYRLDSIKERENFCLQEITATTHAPFSHVESERLSLIDDMPETMKNYLQSVHYADSCIGLLLDKLERDSLLDNTTVVITGDHTIFKSSLLRDFQPFARKYHYPIPEEESFCPLIIYSPNIGEKVVVDEECYQMDIFPTILHCIGAEGYYWKGFGVNLLDSVARKNRPITENEAYILSDKMIRSNFFKKIQ
ncbi:MAG: LTA synthase family protein [Bacteroidales bacterium]|nr:LTA synthase family protein [Bacteroidales bacterium]